MPAFVVHFLSFGQFTVLSVHELRTGHDLAAAFADASRSLTFPRDALEPAANLICFFIACLSPTQVPASRE